MRKKKVWILIVILVTTMGLFYILNAIIPFFGDDILSRYHIRTGEYLDTFPKIVDSAIYSWHDFTGRIIPAIVMPIITVGLGERFFNIYNTLLLLVICIMILRMSNTNIQEKGILTLCVVLFSFFVCLNNEDLLYWCAGSINYLTTSLFLLIFFSLFTKYRSKDIKSWGGIILMLCSIFIASLHEMYACAIAFGLLAYYLLYRKKLSSAFRWMAIGWIIGSCLVILNPALFAKFRMEESIGLMWFLHRIVKFLVSLKLSYFLIGLFFILYWKRKDIIQKAFQEHPLVFLAYLPSMIPAFISGQGGRALWGTEFIALLLVVILLQYFNISKQKNISISLLLFLLCIGLEVHLIKEYRPKWQEYSKVTEKYLLSKNNLVTYQDIRTSTICRLFSNDLNELLDEQIYIKPLKMEKERLHHKKKKTMVAVPKNIFQRAIVEHSSFFSDNTNPNLMGFYDQADFSFMIQPYDYQLLEKIAQGKLYAKYRIKYLPFLKLKVNYSLGDLIKPRPIQVVKTKEYGNYIMLNKQYKHFPFTELEQLGFNNESASTKFEII